MRRIELISRSGVREEFFCRGDWQGQLDVEKLHPFLGQSPMKRASSGSAWVMQVKCGNLASFQNLHSQS